MPDLIPFTPGDNNYNLGVPLGNERVYFNTRWNSSDNVDPDTGVAKGSWYFDLYAEDKTPIAVGVKVVLGVPLCKTSTHPFFTRHVLQAVDTSGQRLDAGYNDLGARVQVVHYRVDELFDELVP